MKNYTEADKRKAYVKYVIHYLNENLHILTICGFDSVASLKRSEVNFRYFTNKKVIEATGKSLITLSPEKNIYKALNLRGTPSHDTLQDIQTIFQIPFSYREVCIKLENSNSEFRKFLKDEQSNTVLVAKEAKDFEDKNTTELKRKKRWRRRKRIAITMLAILSFLSVIIFYLFKYFPSKIEITPEIQTGKKDSITSPFQKQNNLSEVKNRIPVDGNSKILITSSEKDLSTYVNFSEMVDVSVIVVDTAGNIETSLSGDIANVYAKSGKSTGIGLLENRFAKRPEFNDLFEGNSTVIEKLKLNMHTNYLVIGKINYNHFTRPEPDSINVTFACNALIKISIINVAKKYVTQSFTVDSDGPWGNIFSPSGAKQAALKSLLDKYTKEHSFLF